MSVNKFREFVDEVFLVLGLQDSPSKYDSCDILSGGIVFSLRHGREIDPEGVFLFCDFGEVPTEERALVFQRLLEINLFMFGNNAPGFGFNPQNSHITFMVRASLSEITVEGLVLLMGNISAYGQMWHESIFSGSVNADDLKNLASSVSREN